jgi:hypothetical protein
MPFTKLTAATMGSRGGFRTVRKHMKTIAAKGFAATVARHWSGDRKSYTAWLRDHARFALVEAAASVLINAGVSCVELDGDLPETEVSL